MPHRVTSLDRQMTAESRDHLRPRAGLPAVRLSLRGTPAKQVFPLSVSLVPQDRKAVVWAAVLEGDEKPTVAATPKVLVATARSPTMG